MKIVKIILGYILLISTIILSLATVLTLLKSIFDGIKEMQKSTATGIGFLFGTVMMSLLFAIILFFMLRVSLKLIRVKRLIPIDSIDDIGKIE
ncbi:hypothetical protein SAMN05444397_101706 [Flavobacterium aquidurense]|uniref:MotA/TolQ/ExbB proton channel family protein n=1 Tax=Flavobacterium frigidimaris TaxID=262320 RepID=A0ABX4BUM6_FLAFR|nr:hypothetical protein [Flavobacterium frigidimaris]OXA80995.1 hypothetical protein B0A65_05345 [Flavobacterium frigidimaris]SDY46338.1 hypothetical protein SAMN05444397_101706 [Flavobacterium aquidurense]